MKNNKKEFFKEAISSSVSTAYTIIPDGVDRAGFILYCKINCVVTIKNERGVVWKDVPVSEIVMDSISFPQNASSVEGTEVIYAMTSHEKPIVIGVFLPKNRIRLSDGVEEEFHFFKMRESEVSGIKVTPNSLSLYNNSKGSFSLKTSSATIFCRESFKFIADNSKTSFEANSDGFKAITNASFIISASKTELSEGAAYSAVLGEELNANLDNIFDQMDNLATILQNFAKAQSIVCSSTPVLAPLSANLTLLDSNLFIVKNSISLLKEKFTNHLSGKVKLG